MGHHLGDWRNPVQAVEIRRRLWLLRNSPQFAGVQAGGSTGFAATKALPR